MPGLNRTDLAPYKSSLSRIIQKTYDYHGDTQNPWGLRPHEGKEPLLCSFQARCAIGLSLEPRVAEMADDSRCGLISTLLQEDSAAAEAVAKDLFETARVPRIVAVVLGLIQRYHDLLACNREAAYPTYDPLRRILYKRKLERVARFFSIPLKSERIHEA